MLRTLTDARLAVLPAAWLIAVGLASLVTVSSCAALHRVVSDGRVYEGGCTRAGPLVPLSLLLMAPAPLAAVAAMSRPGGSLTRLFGLVALVALEVSFILSSPSAYRLTHPHLVWSEPGGGEVILTGAILPMLGHGDWGTHLWLTVCLLLAVAWLVVGPTSGVGSPGRGKRRWKPPPRSGMHDRHLDG